MTDFESFYIEGLRLNRKIEYLEFKLKRNKEYPDNFLLTNEEINHISQLLKIYKEEKEKKINDLLKEKKYILSHFLEYIELFIDTINQCSYDDINEIKENHNKDTGKEIKENMFQLYSVLEQNGL